MDTNLKNLLNYAVVGVNAQLQKYQQQILLKERFGAEACTIPDLYNPADKEKSERLVRDIETNYNNLLEFAKKLHSFRTAQFDKAFEDSLNHYFNQKK